MIILDYTNENNKYQFNITYDTDQTMYKFEIEDFKEPEQISALQEYLYIHSVGDKTLGMKKSERDKIMKYWLNIYQKEYPDIKLKDLTKTGVSHRINEIKSDLDFESIIIPTNKITIHNINSFSPIISFKCRNKLISLTETDFINRLTDESKKLYNDKKKKNELNVSLIKNSIENLKFSNTIKHRSKHKIRADKEKNRYLERKNTNNCFLFALNCISKNFTIRKNMKLFKGKDFIDQLFLANSILNKKENKTLLYAETVCSQLLDYVKSIEDTSIIVFSVSNKVFHCEAIENNSFIMDPQPHIKNLYFTKRTITRYKLICL